MTSLDLLFDIASPEAEKILQVNRLLGSKETEEDLMFLEDQRGPRVGSMSGRDKVYDHAVQRKRIREEMTAARVEKENERVNESKQTSAEKEDENSDEEDDIDNNDSDFKASEMKRSKKVDIMGPVSQVADRLNISCRTMAMTSAATVKAMGLQVADTNISVTTAWRKRTQGRLEVAATIKENFVPSKFLALHWDGKTLNMSRGDRANFVAIYVTGVEEGQPQQLLGIPQAPGGKGKEEFNTIKTVLEAWGIKEQVIPIVFDTTLANSGEFQGVCRYNLIFIFTIITHLIVIVINIVCVNILLNFSHIT